MEIITGVERRRRWSVEETLRLVAEVACPKWAYRHRHLVENLWARLKEWRAVATRYEKTAASFFSVILIAATTDYIKT